MKLRSASSSRSSVAPTASMAARAALAWLRRRSCVSSWSLGRRWSRSRRRPVGRHWCARGPGCGSIPSW
eukprot:4886473-Alexandrium_andersonii.AAC.1